MSAIKILVLFGALRVFHTVQAMAFQQDCGDTPLYPTLQIVGGVIVPPDEYSWLASLQYGNNGSFGVCGGSVISSWYVLTAAHCVAGETVKTYGGLTGVRLGNFTQKPYCDYGTSNCTAYLHFGIANIIKHEDYIPRTVFNDIALIRVDSIIPFGKVLKPVCLPRDDVKKPDINTMLTVTGWGRTMMPNDFPAKRAVGITIVNDTLVCENQGPPGSIMCAGVLSNYITAAKTSCMGDSGGPLMQQFGIKKMMIEGIVSFVPGSSCVSQFVTTYYTRVRHYVKWIEGHLYHGGINSNNNYTSLVSEPQLKLPMGMAPEQADPEIEKKRLKVKEMMEHAWHNYKLYAWGKNELSPLSQRQYYGSIFGSYDLGATIVDSLDTLYIMGLEKEYKEGRDWIESRFSLDNIMDELSVFEMNTRFVGGLLTLYALTGDPLYKEKAQHVADKLLPAFQTPTGIPLGRIIPKTGLISIGGFAIFTSTILSNFGGLHLEFAYLSDITGNPLYRERVQTIRQVVKQIEKREGLYPIFLNTSRGFHASLDSFGHSFYEYLLKAWIQSGQTDEEARDMYDEAMLAIMNKMLRNSTNGLTYVSNLFDNKLNHRMDQVACFSGGLFALGAATRQNEHTDKYMEVGKGITNTCHESYRRTRTQLGYESFRFSDEAEALELIPVFKAYNLRSETFESYFVLWRLTHDPKYRDWGWEAVLALEKHCRTEHGYCGLENVDEQEPNKSDKQPSYFLASTLKYLYLLFSDDSVLPLNEWVFNTAAHPLPIKGANILYRQAPVTLPPSNG